MPVTKLPRVDEICKDLIGAPYTAQLDCWNFVHLLISKTFPHIILPKDIFACADFLVEIWNKFDNTDYLQCIFPWDIVLFCNSGNFVDHCGLVVNIEKFVHTNETTGVCIEYLHNHSSKIFQIARLQHFV